MYRATTGIHLQFAHHVRGHRGPCISLHGHTWRFDVTLEARILDAEGFVVDFDLVHERLLQPIFRLLDHSLALGETSFAETEALLAPLGVALVASRKTTIGHLGEPPPVLEGTLAGARNERPGGVKIAVFPFTPTSERLAEWLYRAADELFAGGDNRVRVARARIYESLHPDESIADFVPEPDEQRPLLS
jgi:6-pyruvoyl-tetrahydropterin synthase